MEALSNLTITLIIFLLLFPKIDDLKQQAAAGGTAFILVYPLLVSALNASFFSQKRSARVFHPFPDRKSLFIPSQTRMQTVVNPLTLTTACGLPLCATGITHRFNVSQQVSDHEHRRKALKERRSRENPSPNGEVGFARLLEKVMKEAFGEELELCYRLSARAA